MAFFITTPYMKKVIILIDGQNLYYNLKELGFIERQIKWDKLFHSFLDTDNDELVRTYWFRAGKLLDHYYSEQNIKSTICWKLHRTHSDNFNCGKLDTIPKNVLQQINDEFEKVNSWISNVRDRFNQQEYAYDQLSLEYGDIEIVKNGVVKIDPYKYTFIGEKGVDIALAVKMISLSVQQKCDKIILISGDYDYAEAIKFVKDNMTKIHIVKIHKGYPPKNRSVSRELSVLADRVIDLYESNLRENFLNEKYNRQDTE